MKSTFTAPQRPSNSSSTRNFSPPSSKALSLSFGSSRANPRDGPLHPPCIKAMRMAELILFCSRYAFRLLTASAVTSNIHASSKEKEFPPSRLERKGYGCKIRCTGMQVNRQSARALSSNKLGNIPENRDLGKQDHAFPAKMSAIQARSGWRPDCGPASGVIDQGGEKAVLVLEKDCQTEHRLLLFC